MLSEEEDLANKTHKVAFQGVAFLLDLSNNKFNF